MTDPEFVQALENAGLLQDEYPEQMAAACCTCTGAAGDTTCGAHRLLERYDALFAAFQESNRQKQKQHVRALDAEATVEQARQLAAKVNPYGPRHAIDHMALDALLELLAPPAPHEEKTE